MGGILFNVRWRDGVRMGRGESFVILRVDMSIVISMGRELFIDLSLGFLVNIF